MISVNLRDMSTIVQYIVSCFNLKIMSTMDFIDIVLQR